MPLLRLRFLNGSRRGREAAFAHSPVRIGRSRENDLVLPEPDAPTSSANHAEVRHERGRWWVVDLESTNGTYLNDVRVGRSTIKTGDRLAFGDQLVAVEVERPRRGRFAAAAAVLALVVAAAAYVAWRSGPGPLDAIAGQAARSTFLIVLEEGTERRAVGTAFAVTREGHLATNAHVAAAVQAALTGSRPGTPRAIGDRGHSQPLQIVAATLHPKWTAGSIRDDVAVLRLEKDAATSPVALASAEALAGIKPGEPIALFGFPAAFTDPMHPRGSLAVNTIREVRGRYLVIGVSIAPGASGSPVFNFNGAVVGLVAGSGRMGQNGKNWDATSPAVALTIDSLREILE